MAESRAVSAARRRVAILLLLYCTTGPARQRSARMGGAISLVGTGGAGVVALLVRHHSRQHLRRPEEVLNDHPASTSLALRDRQQEPVRHEPRQAPLRFLALAREPFLVLCACAL